MYLTNFDEFYAASEQLFRASPSKARLLRLSFLPSRKRTLQSSMSDA
jgi:hypothetical protein